MLGPIQGERIVKAKRMFEVLVMGGAVIATGALGAAACGTSNTPPDAGTPTDGGSSCYCDAGSDTWSSGVFCNSCCCWLKSGCSTSSAACCP